MAELPQQHEEARSETFGYVCHACSRCCHHKLIQTNPYEIARLARNRGVSTSEFAARWTVEGAGTHLAQTRDGACVFLGEQGCSVHPDRPLVCRVYPLGRIRQGDGNERWKHLDPHPRTEGKYSEDGTIADYLGQQGAQPFILAADAYVEWIHAAREAQATGRLSKAGEEDIGNLLDMDEAVAAYCTRHEIEPPESVDARMDLHLKLLYGLLLETGRD